MPILNYQMVDDSEREREFDTFDEVLQYLRGQRDIDFEWVTLYLGADDSSIDGYSNCLIYCIENQELP